jgi:UDP-glucose 4-epimerase
MNPATVGSWPPLHVGITGGMGFVGSHLADALLAEGRSVTVIDNLSTGQVANVAHLRSHPRYREIVADVRSVESIAVLESEVDLVVHLAAAVGVKLTVENPVETIETNVDGTEAVLRAARKRNTKVLIASTSEVYGKANKIPFSENDDVTLGPTTLPCWGYAASKMVDEFLALGYWRQFGLPTLVMRLFNVVGPRQSDFYVVPRFVRSALRGETLEIYGDGSQTRCLTHIDDTIRAITALIRCDDAVGQVFNIGADGEVTILELAHRILRAVGVGSPSDHCRFVPYRDVYGQDFEDPQRRVPDTSKLTAYTGWQPSFGLDRIITDVIGHLSDPAVRVSRTSDLG